MIPFVISQNNFKWGLGLNNAKSKGDMSIKASQIICNSTIFFYIFQANNK